MKHVFATQSVIVSHPASGEAVAVHHGSHWWEGDPIVTAYPDFFTDDARFALTSSTPFREDGYPQGYYGPEVQETKTAPTPTETATKAPGEKRTRR